MVYICVTESQKKYINESGNIMVVEFKRILNKIKLLIIECKWKENVYQNRENYIRIEDALKKIYDFYLFWNYPVPYIRMGSIHIKKTCKAGNTTESSR